MFIRLEVDISTLNVEFDISRVKKWLYLGCNLNVEGGVYMAVIATVRRVLIGMLTWNDMSLCWDLVRSH